MTAAQAAENHGDESGLTWYLRWGIYRSILTWTHSKDSLSLKIGILPWKISRMIPKTVPISTRIVISYAIKQCIPFWVWQKISGNWDNNMINMIRIFQWRGSQCRKNTSIRRKKKIQKCRVVRVTFRDPSRKISHLSEVIWDRKIITEITRSINSYRID